MLIFFYVLSSRECLQVNAQVIYSLVWFHLKEQDPTFYVFKDL